MDEEKSLLFRESSAGEGSQNIIAHHRSCLRTLSNHPWLLAYHILIHLLLLVALFYAFIPQSSHSDIYQSLSIFPELRTLRHVTSKTHMTKHSEHSSFSGPPSTENDDDWKELLRPIYFNASARELKKAHIDESDAVRYAGGGFIASLGVYHDMHCLRKLRHWLYREKYLPDMSPRDEANMLEHLDHCIDMIRVSLMCTPDLSFYAFNWPKGEKTVFLDPESNSPRQCIDWKQLTQWSQERMVGSDIDLLRDT